MSELIIRCKRCVLVIDENDLLRNIPPGILEAAIKKGKGYKRFQRVAQYEKSRAEYETEDIYGKEGDK